MADSFRLQIVTPERTVYSEEVVSMIAPGVDGYFGVLARHAPMLAEIGVGRLVTERADGSRDVLSVAGGFLQVRDEATMVLADAAEPRDNIDLQRARQALERARERLSNRTAGLDVERAEAARDRALSRIEIAG